MAYNYSRNYLIYSSELWLIQGGGVINWVGSHPCTISAFRPLYRMYESCMPSPNLRRVDTHVLGSQVQQMPCVTAHSYLCKLLDNTE